MRNPVFPIDLPPIQLPDHWMKHFFLAHTYLELQLNEAALETYFGLQMGGGPGQGLHDSTYILAQVAIGQLLNKCSYQSVIVTPSIWHSMPCCPFQLSTTCARWTRR